MTATPASATFLLHQPRQVQGFREVLAEGVALTMLWIPPGRFWMGSPDSEPGRSDDEGPRHLVQMQGFFMGQTPITQAQWRMVAEWTEQPGEHWGSELKSNPSRYRTRPDSDQHPVTGVDWHGAKSFCTRISQRSGRRYALPSEAQWEYACRAGTSSSFHFGDTISPALANYSRSRIHTDGAEARGRERTTPVGSFPANAGGLHDMHGNVSEWCLDDYQNNYEGAPADGSAWEKRFSTDSQQFNIMRGGGWYSNESELRSASRSLDNSMFTYSDDHVGFRVVCLPQDPSLNP